MRKVAVRVSLVAVTVLLEGCGSLPGPEVCTSDLTWRVTPDEAELAVGESITVKAEAFGCGGTEPLDEDMRWTSANPTIATVDPMTGRVVAMDPGNTVITGKDEGPYAIGPVEVPVTVLP